MNGYGVKSSGATATALVPRVAVFHDQPMVAEGLGHVLGSGGEVEVVAVGSRVGRFARTIGSLRPAVVVFGFAASRRTQAVRVLRRLSEATVGDGPFLVGVVSGGQAAADALGGAAGAVITTDVTGAALREIVRDVACRDAVGVPVELVRPVTPAPPRAAMPRDGRLTGREREVLLAIGQGRSTSEIAEALGISVNTARTHAQRLMAKLRVHSRLQASALAADQPHLVAPPGGV